MGIDENDVNYKHNRWCYDTPGVVQPDQVTTSIYKQISHLLLPILDNPPFDDRRISTHTTKEHNKTENLQPVR